MSERRAPAAFYCVSSSAYFLGAVGLVNSLRLAGHTEPIHLLDCGLSEPQRELLGREVNLIGAPAGVPPVLLKTIAPRRHPADVMVLIDADIVVTRSLSGLIARAAEGRAIAVENPIDRFVPRWGELLGLGPNRRQTYVSSGLVLIGAPPGDEVLRLLEESQRQVEYERGYLERDDPDYPWLYLDQDVLNAILATVVPPERFEAIDNRLVPVPPFEGLRVADAKAMRCTYADGSEPYGVHQYLPLKPWLAAIHDGVYSTLLRQALGGQGIAVRVPPAELPLRLRGGRLAAAERRRINATEQLRWRLGGLLGARGAHRQELRRRQAASRT